MPKPLAVFVTFTVVSFTWILFRFGDFSTILGLWSAMAGLAPLGIGSISAADLGFLGLVTAGTLWFRNACERWPGGSGPAESVSLWALAIFAVLSAPQVNQFIYFQF